MPSDLASYLAENYLTAETKPSSSKKRKRKHDKKSTGLFIQDDDDWGPGGGSTSRKTRHDDDPDDLAPITVGKVREFRKTTKANWKSIGGGGSKDEQDSAAAADAILAAAAAETANARAADDDAPAIVQEEAGAAGATSAMMADGSHAGLQSAAAVTAQLERRQREEREQFEAERRAGLVKHGGANDGDDEDQTYYRDATGRRVDVSMKRAEARRAALEAEEKERQKVEALKGEIQIEEAKRRQERLQEAKTMSLARGVDDEEMNREMKEERRWNDPMARFLGAEDEAPTSSSVGGDKAGKKTSKRPVYKGAAPPNRYGIRPGYRWDGVDRSNGFEAERFKALNRRERNKGLEYSWQMDE